jgi:hypothetical protein
MKVFRALAYLIALEVVVQAAAIAFGLFGLSKWIDDGHAATKASIDEGDGDFGGKAGFAIHGLNGMLIIPVLAIALLITAFVVRRKVAGAVKAAAIVFGLVVLQIFLGIISHDVPGLGALHAINAFVLLGFAAQAGYRATSSAASAPAPAV